MGGATSPNSVYMLRRSTGLGFATFCLREYATAKRHIHATVLGNMKNKIGK